MRIPGRFRPRLLQLLDRWPDECWGRTCFSQEGEDVLIWRMLEHFLPKEGTYVDVGSNHPWQYSNTAFFYRRGWQGVAIDPNPDFAPLFASERPRDRFLTLGIAATPGELTFHRFAESCYSTFSAERAAELQAKGHGGAVETCRVPVIPLREALSGVWPEGKALDLLSIDAEGMDEEILRSHDFTRFPADVLVVEHETFRVDESSQEPLSRFLTGLGYFQVAKLLKSGIFLSAALTNRMGL